ncbi:flagellar basal body-associated FliL family protein [Jannaschia marina]|uniref:flagellar basal body-associated FliL family protein n=1 Tax=Jannaschia marina TaxID=2741674 RepID=UPI001F1A4710|nr:flagellar basal body-associated FliL family protein [Jannaschia marina]
MADPEEEAVDSAPEKKGGMGKLGWIVTLVAALALGGGAFFVTFSGLVGLPSEEAAAPEAGTGPLAPQFLELDPMMITVGGAGSTKQLRFRAFLQLEPGAEQIAALQPRILDVFSTYLRAVSVARLEDPTALLDLRAQLLRRVQLLAGADVVSDLLIIDFVIT